MSWADSCDDDYALDALKEEVDDLKAENAELRKELAVTNPLFETLNAANDRLIYENMKLRELVWDMRAVIWAYDESTSDDDCPPALPLLEDRLRELGVEVDV